MSCTEKKNPKNLKQNKNQEQKNPSKTHKKHQNEKKP